jgi:hypothetical protein
MLDDFGKHLTHIKCIKRSKKRGKGLTISGSLINNNDNTTSSNGRGNLIEEKAHLDLRNSVRMPKTLIKAVNFNFHQRSKNIKQTRTFASTVDIQAIVAMIALILSIQNMSHFEMIARLRPNHFEGRNDHM